MKGLSPRLSARNANRVARRDTALLNYGLDVHKKYTSICVMDDLGTIVSEGRSVTAELPVHPAFSLAGKKRAVMEAGGNWHFVYDLLEPHVDELMLAHPLRVRAIANCQSQDRYHRRQNPGAPIAVRPYPRGLRASD